MRQTATYRVRVQGVIGPEWSSWFAGLTVRAEPDGTTSLTGDLPDQAALHGLLAAIRDLGMSLVSVETVVRPEGPNPPGF